jgi:hypothetical protein
MANDGIMDRATGLSTYNYFVSRGADWAQALICVRNAASNKALQLTAR